MDHTELEVIDAQSQVGGHYGYCSNLKVAHDINLAGLFLFCSLVQCLHHQLSLRLLQCWRKYSLLPYLLLVNVSMLL